MGTGTSPNKGSDIYVWAGLSSDTKPTTAFIGQKIIETDTGLVFEWDGANWCPRIDGVEIDRLVKSVPTTSTFHHLCHEGYVFIQNKRYADIADAANLDLLVRMPAGNADRQVHMRFSFLGEANTGTLDVDIVMYKDTTVSADGSAQTIVNVSDYFNAKTTGVEIYEGPTVTDVGTPKPVSALLGTKKGASSEESHVPEWILTPDGESERNYLFRLTNNSGGTVDIIDSIFFFDSKAV